MRHLCLVALVATGCGGERAVVECHTSPIAPRALPSPAQTWASTPCDAHVAEAAARARLDPRLLRAVIHVESRGRRRARSSKGAVGCMQLIESTARAMGVTDRTDARQNVLGGAAYLRTLLDRFDGSVVRALGGYNAGPGRVKTRKSAWKAVPNKGYVCSVLKAWDSDDGRRLHAQGCRATTGGVALLDGLHPTLRHKALVLAERARAAGVPVKFISGFRRPRRKPSWHQFGLALDLNLAHRKTMKDALAHYAADEAQWAKVGAIAEGLGLTWGLPWRLSEVFHFEWHPGYPAAITPKRARELTVRAGGDTPEMVWKLFDTTG